jgi:putative acetyltransferase
MKYKLPEGFSYVEAKNADIPTAQALIFQVLEEHGLHTNDTSLDTDMQDIEQHYQNGFFGLIRNVELHTIGTFALFAESTDSFEIRKMYLLPEYRGKGIGRWMLYFLIEKARALAAQKLTLKTASVLEAAMALYRKAGFDEVTTSSCNPRCDRAFEINLNHFIQHSEQ